MNRKSIYKVFIILIIAMCATIASKTNTYATEAQTNRTRTQNTSSSQMQVSNSSNANLSNLGVTPYDFSGFKPEVTEYAITVASDVTSVEVYANVAANGATFTVDGDAENLQEGENKIGVIVTAPDGITTKTYTITITRKESEKEEVIEEDEDENEVEETTTTTAEPEKDTNQKEAQVGEKSKMVILAVGAIAIIICVVLLIKIKRNKVYKPKISDSYNDQYYKDFYIINKKWGEQTEDEEETDISEEIEKKENNVDEK